MAEAPPPQGLPDDIDPDFEPLSRPRSCTWPLPRPELVDPASSATSSPAPSVQQEPGGAEFISGLGLLKEDYEEYAEEKQPCGVFQCQGGELRAAPSPAAAAAGPAAAASATGAPFRGPEKDQLIPAQRLGEHVVR
ncbi:Forkhead box protein O1-A [Oryzias melastigma]|uniref:Forkhead box protein O1-A n=1 Tax=Oryzias melastigma TaxID=30732 RepID=A0A834FC89_ORYME|nr:Forkhead box protein O1-A [Oryzias melastigma]